MSETETPKAARIAWLMPPMIEGSGGHRTMLQNAQALIGAGHRCDIYVERKRGSGPEAQAEARRQVREYFGFESEGVYSGFELKGEYDMVIATAWWTAQIAAGMPVRHKAYFVQDFEAMFNPMGDGYLMAENSYRLGLTPITIGRWLTHKLATEFGASGTWFDFCADRGVYRRLAGVEREDAVCFIYQPEKPRRCPHLGMLALSILRHHRPSVKIYLYGTREKTDFPLEHEHLGLLSVEQCNELYNRCRVGLCISSSNPSRIPFEMMAAGLPVVDVHRENNLYDMPDGGVLLARQSPEEMAKAMLMVLEDAGRFETMSSFGASFMSPRPLEHGFGQFVAAVEDILAGRTGRWAQRCSRMEPMYMRSASLPASRVRDHEAGVRARAAAEIEVKRVAATRELASIERSLAWRAVRSIKGNPLYRAYAEVRYGPGWEMIHAEQDPCERLRRVRASGAFRMIERVKGSGLYQTYAAQKRRMVRR